MQKKNYSNVNLSCVLQQDAEITSKKCLTGIISKTYTGFRFEEAVRKGRAPRNPKLFDGKFVSMVRMQNGKYQMHLKTMDTADFNPESFAFGVFTEISNALRIID